MADSGGETEENGRHNAEITPKKRGRGRPPSKNRKVPVEKTGPKRPRGRPPKKAKKEEEEEKEHEEEEVAAKTVKRVSLGRPPKKMLKVLGEGKFEEKAEEVAEVPVSHPVKKGGGRKSKKASTSAGEEAVAKSPDALTPKRRRGRPGKNIGTSS